jgi:hypothetical protein
MEKMISKINIVPIVKGHLESFKDRDGKKYIIGDCIGFYLIPFAFAVFLVIQDFQVDDKYIQTAIIAETIFVPLLVNVLVVVYGLIDRIEKRRGERTDFAADKAFLQVDNKKIRLLRQLYSNIAYTILLSCICLGSLAIYSVKSIPSWLVCTNRIILYFLIMHLLLTALMIMKRLHILLEKELE